MTTSKIESFGNKITKTDWDGSTQIPMVGDNIHYVDPKTGYHHAGTIVDINEEESTVDVVYFGPPSGKAETMQLLNAEGIAYESTIDGVSGYAKCSPGACHRMDHTTHTEVPEEAKDATEAELEEAKDAVVEETKAQEMPHDDKVTGGATPIVEGAEAEKAAAVITGAGKSEGDTGGTGGSKPAASPAAGGKGGAPAK